MERFWLNMSPADRIDDSGKSREKNMSKKVDFSYPTEYHVCVKKQEFSNGDVWKRAGKTVPDDPTPLFECF